MIKLFDKLKSLKQTPEEKADIAAEIRTQIISDAEAMKRLSSNADFLRFFEILQEDKAALNNNLVNEDYSIKDREARTRLIARINQIDRVIDKPKSLIWRMENLTEVREAIKEQTRVRQAHGNKTGG